ncbi:hypothetical protein L596_000941 [Steinernema carpocapsae]|uniref:Uncharacterized protein n=1 Tax=Steinernema carpocapsae TaxID=34508 RepID=A0A4U8UJZ6_STECR|nr:hypothetical protein L596_000941 [Steinernema carpocapsae]
MELEEYISITEVMNFAVRRVSELQTNIVSVKRLKEYSETPIEAEWVLSDSSLPKGWPIDGLIELVGYSTRYRPGERMKKGEKIGIV